MNIGKLINFSKDSIVMMDRRYTDFTWYGVLIDQGTNLATQLKGNAAYEAINRQKANKKAGISSDQITEFLALTA